MKASRKTSGKDQILSKVESMFKHDIKSSLPSTISVIKSTCKKIDSKLSGLSSVQLRREFRDI